MVRAARLTAVSASISTPVGAMVFAVASMAIPFSSMTNSTFTWLSGIWWQRGISNCVAHSSGAVWLAYRDLDEQHVRNMAFAVSGDGARTFVPRGTIADDQWSVHGCPESGPRLAEGRDGRVWAAWTNGKGPQIEVAAAATGGRFGAPQVIARGAVNHPEIGTLPDGRIAVFYESMNDVVARFADPRGSKWSEPRVVIAGGRLPRYARHGEHTALAAMRGKEIVIVEVAP